MLETTAEYRLADESCFFKCIKWAPDGSVLLSNAEDNRLRLHTVDSLQVVREMGEPESIHDICWYPWMNTPHTGTCCFLTATRDQPIHLWDSSSGSIRCSYAAVDYADQVTTCYATLFSADGRRVLAGSTKALHVFDVSRPGRPIAVLPLSSSRRARDGPAGPISALDVRMDDSGLTAAGCFSGAIGMYDVRVAEDAALVMLLPGHQEGVSQVAFGADGWSLFSAARKEDAILHWDLRNGSLLARYGPRASSTNQRLYFAINAGSNSLLAGDQLGSLREFPLKSLLSPVAVEETLMENASESCKVVDDVISSVATSPHHPDRVVLSTGERHFVSVLPSSDDDADVDDDDGAKVHTHTHTPTPTNANANTNTPRICNDNSINTSLDRPRYSSLLSLKRTNNKS